MNLPTNMIVIAIIVVLVLAVVGAFLLTSAGGQSSSAGANKIFAEGCLRYCTSSAEQNYLNAYEIKKNDQQFLNACVQLGYGTEEFPVQCLQRCGCDLTTSQNEINTRLQELITNVETA
ncbi:MAG: hypothetical protein HY513_01420 [Candidatus Aenigmarchaeota archaeon]|nr:hypothetical protein [Candidatus Aenigmarchaeota archaeon]